ncbi:S-adenosyl-L-methionine-dependent methyltransferase [Basidiobolus meristosporus CBS 931.73]|uniref:S-adenosyl-L-methionine-dependent methyltransferase n=1 Tax=Basidiobolus meristosporus CBS 931.73 TaxID=1314790 RepID=A0A1Y1YBE6_9FUNG|nr:S-adenosyl-L-methionine-dependent methyltransferase [Basidiobolus meristosporus CBS 931.73]|eukprot:ORX95340.1 S-adenosyl-L-methionine-dependent methyltransferase [Basidiobolus meristosporus CBS 931.73]
MSETDIVDPIALVKEGYDKIALDYLAWAEESNTADNTTNSPRLKYLEKLYELAPAQNTTRLLELGCATGLPWTQKMLEKGYQITAVDLSERQIQLARENLKRWISANPAENSVDLVSADMMKLAYSNYTFDAVVAFFSIIHVPRDMQLVLLENIYNWLKPGGYFICNLATMDVPVIYDPNWIGAPMYWSSWSCSKIREHLSSVGFVFVDDEVIVENEHGAEIEFWWFVVQKPITKQE